MLFNANLTFWFALCSVQESVALFVGLSTNATLAYRLHRTCQKKVPTNNKHSIKDNLRTLHIFRYGYRQPVH